ncbi:hypothetical protein [Compostimonas suwonensis]|uniref:Uncharacterized protein n=1 Tax=Compostimonas suwonensis TaxID=1048394 RepID=A0A2M9BCF5_9MICO|nr:hypothetical protein [Compostimonas suwonensis]PJJ55630.1 hypothetical protein CLV54_2977 [Compostimonas suwonensis]
MSETASSVWREERREERRGERRGWTTGRAALALLCVVVLGAGLSLFSARAYAILVDVPETGVPGHLALQSDPLPAQFLALSPGEPAFWQIGAQLSDAERSSLSLEIRKDGAVVEHPRGLVVTVQRCDEPWVGAECASGAAEVLTATPSDDYASSSPIVDLDGLDAQSGRYLLVELAVEDSAAARADESLMGLTGDLGFGLTAAADSPPGPPTPSGTPAPPQGAPVAPDRLPSMGVDAAALALLALGFGGLALTVGGARRPRSPQAAPAEERRP